MAASNSERIGRGLELLRDGIRPFAEREFKKRFGADWTKAAAPPIDAPTSPDDVGFLLTAMQQKWNDVFRTVLGRAERSYVLELSEVRNSWAHQRPFSSSDTYRALDTMQRLLLSVSAGEQAAEVDRLLRDLQRTRYTEEARSVERRVAATPISGEPAPGLKPWRDVIAPHPDVRGGTYQQAEFAADLHQVWRDEATDEYGKPEEFFRRTFLTDGLKALLLNAVRRWEGKGAGDPVVELQTNFGGGKTHSLIALYHLAGGYPPAKLPGVDQMLAEASLPVPPRIDTAVLACQQIEPGKVHRKADGTEVRTLWGELAWQLGGAETYALVAESDRTSTSPGASLIDVFKRHSPCLVLIDEWVTYARQLYGSQSLPAGSADVQFSFAQVLAEAARAVPGALVVISIPSSDIEVGGEHGREVLDRLKNVIGRVESPWRPATAEEGFEIVRRRLFEEMSAENARDRDAVVRAFGELYRKNLEQFPAGSGERDYERRLAAAYPIHPELFDRLYGDWSALDKFQRTRGVLRLMAAVIHRLWIGGDSSVMILPASVPIAADSVMAELTRYLEGNWAPVIESDVDGPNALPLRLDQQDKNAGRYSATRRVARTIYMGSAPTANAPHRGIDDRSIKLGCVQPGEHPALFGDALRKLSETATYLYTDRQRYWFSTVPSVTSLALGREQTHVSAEAVDEEIVRRLRDAARQRGQFHAIHFASSPADVPDEDKARLVVLTPAYTHVRGDEGSQATAAARSILSGRSGGDRRYRNMLIFLAADHNQLKTLRDAARRYLAWTSIDKDRQDGALNLDDFQKGLIAKHITDGNERVDGQLAETYQWLLVPAQRAEESLERWQAIRVTGAGVYERASKRLVEDGLLIPKYAGANLKLDLDGRSDSVALWRDGRVGVKQLWNDFAINLFLPRLRDVEVLRSSIAEAVAGLSWQLDGFAYASAYDENTGRYLGLLAGRHMDPLIDGSAVLVRSDVAVQQLERERPDLTTVPLGAGGNGPQPPVPAALPRHFYGRKVADPVRLVRDAGDIAETIVQELKAKPSARVKVVIQVEADDDEGFGADVQRVVSENARTLKFDEQEFTS